MKKILIFLVIVVSVGFLFLNGVPQTAIGKYLSPTDPTQKADAIIAVSGSEERVKHAVALYKQGLSSKLIFSGAAKEGVSNALAMKLEAEQDGVPKESILLEERATNTYENALFTNEIIKKENFKSIILVTSPYHQRRAFESFQTVLKNESITITNSPAEESSWKADNWWKDDQQKSITFSEISKLVWSRITGNYR